MNVPKLNATWIKWTAVTLVIGFAAITVFAQNRTTLERTDPTARRVVNAVDALRRIENPVARSDARTAIANMQPKATTLALLTERHRKSDSFMRTQIESVVAQMRFPDDPEIVFAVATATHDSDFFVATVFALGYSQTAAARALTFDLFNAHQFGADPAQSETAEFAVEHVLLDSLEPTDLQWLAEKVEAGSLTDSQTRFAMKAAERLPGDSALRILRRLVVDADTGRAELEKRITTMEHALRPRTQ